jgi:transposase
MKKHKSVDFAGTNIYIGIDVHKKSWHVTILYGDVSKRNTFEPSAEILKKHLEKHYPNGRYNAVYEAGYFGFNTYYELTKLGIETIVVNPADIPRTDKEKRNKTDKSDSYKLALALRSGFLKGIYIPSIEAQELRSLTRRREELVQDQTRSKNRIKSLLSQYNIKYPEQFTKLGSHWSKRFINWLKEIKFKTTAGNQAIQSQIQMLEIIRTELLEVTRIIRKELKDLKLKNNYEKLIKIPGIGQTGAAVLQTEIMEIERFTSRDKFISYIGLSPNEQSSGESRKIGHLTRRCNKRIRTILIEASWLAIKYDPALGQYYNERIVTIGKQKTIIKVARKLANRIRHILLTEETYEIGIVQ